MAEFLLLRLAAPLMSFGGVRVDNRGVTQEFPGLSMITGLIGNALGLDHRDAGALTRLQERIRYGVRCDRPGSILRDFQTVDITQPFMTEGWTTRGAPEGRAGGQETRNNLHIREREFLADAAYTIALALEPGGEAPTLDHVARALDEPERPLFVGRKPCLPSSPLLLARSQAGSLVEALAHAPALGRPIPAGRTLRAWLPAEVSADCAGTELTVTDERDWVNQIVVGRRVLKMTTVTIQEDASDVR
ncbi:MAG: type I-E CRISPR-associated protein Cas5/CasD [Anaeromyxobacter sp.]